MDIPFELKNKKYRQMKKLLSLIAFLLNFTLFSQIYYHEEDRNTLECTSVTVGRLASADGSVMTSHSDDSQRTRTNIMIEGGANLRAVQEMLGHESITTTEIYTHLDKDYIKSTIALHHPRY
jgi:integrase